MLDNGYHPSPNKMYCRGCGRMISGRDATIYQSINPNGRGYYTVPKLVFCDICIGHIRRTSAIFLSPYRSAPIDTTDFSNS